MNPVAFVSESWAEIKRVSRPTRQETIQATLVVLMMMVVVSLFLWLVDWLFSSVMRIVLS